MRTSEQERAAFESLIVDLGLPCSLVPFSRDENGEYANGDQADLWYLWQAARAQAPPHRQRCLCGRVAYEKENVR